MSFSVTRFGSAPSVDLTIRVRQTFNSAALLKASASIPDTSIPPTAELFKVFAVAAVAFFKLLIIVVLGIVLMILPLILNRVNCVERRAVNKQVPCAAANLAAGSRIPGVKLLST